MIEWIMFFCGGFLAAILLAFVMMSVVHHRAVRLTRRGFKRLVPLSLVELQAAKDGLRAEFALSTQRLEADVERLRFKAATQLIEIGRKSEMIIRLKSEGVRPTEIASRLGIARASVYRALGAQNGDRVATDRAPIELLARPSISTNKPIDSIASNGTGHDQDGVGVRRAGAADSLVVSFWTVDDASACFLWLLTRLLASHRQPTSRSARLSHATTKIPFVNQSLFLR